MHIKRSAGGKEKAGVAEVVIKAVVWPAAAVVALLLFCLLFWGRIAALIDRISKVSKAGFETSEVPSQASSTTTLTTTGITAPAAGSTTDASSEAAHALLRGVMTSPVVVESEQQIRRELSAGGVDPARATDQLLHLLAIAAVTIRFERTYSDIFGSQIQILQHLSNVGTAGATQSQLRPFYDAAAQRYPDVYRNYAFDAYLNYLINTAQLVSHNGDRLVIDFAGREFLSYLTRAGKTTAKFF
jgi:hypothetical protein